MPYIKIYVHCVWATKNRKSLLNKEARIHVFDHIRQNAKQKGIFIDHINGVEDHVHCLISMKADQNISKLMNLIKGESSFWINKNNIIKHRFQWQEEYFAISISSSHIERVRAYIRNQEEHHRKITWVEEYDQFVSEYGFQRIMD